MSGGDVASGPAAVAREILAASEVIVCSHLDPDGDAIGSTLALYHALTQLGIKVTPVVASGAAIPRTYLFLPGADRVLPAATATPAPLFIALDTPVLARLGDAEALARACARVAMVDHHPDATPGADAIWFDSKAAATGELIWRLLPELGVTPDADIAACCYTALVTDTGRFSYSNTTAATLRDAADMIDAGAQPHEIYTSVYESRTAAAQSLVGRALARVTLANSGHVAYSWVSQTDFAESGALPEEGEDLIDSVRVLGGVDAVFLAKINGGTVKISLRAKSDADVGAIARQFGGGGHRAAAGFTAEGDLESVLVRLLPLLPGGRR